MYNITLHYRFRPVMINRKKNKYYYHTDSVINNHTIRSEREVCAHANRRRSNLTVYLYGYNIMRRVHFSVVRDGSIKPGSPENRRNIINIHKNNNNREAKTFRIQ